MIGLSTAWFSETALDVGLWVETLQELGVAGLELEYRVRESFSSSLRPKLVQKGFKILSVHNYFPFPEQYKHLKPSGDLFLLSSLDREEQEKAVVYSIKTIENAHDLECSAVVLHLGKVDMKSYFPEFCRFYEYQKKGSSEMEEFVSSVRAERKKKKQPYLDTVCFSLDKLVREAEKREVRLGVENRYYFHEIPNREELGIILDRFDGAPVFHWHDVGHGFVQEQLGYESHKELLERYGHRLLGVHLHDSNGYADHQAPGMGKVDFAWLKQYVNDETVKILEIHPHVGLEAIKEGHNLLKELGY